MATSAGGLPRERTAGSPLGLHRVIEPAGALPQAAWRLDASPELWPDETRVRVDRLNLDAASFRQLTEASGGDPDKVRAAVLGIVAERGKMQNPVTGSGGMLIGVVEESGPGSPLGLAPGDRIATLVSLSLTPLVITDGLAGWDGRSEQVPCRGHAILFGRSIATVLPADLPGPLALAVLAVCGAPALTGRVVSQAAGRAGGSPPVVAVLGAAGKSGSLSAVAARRAGAGLIIGVVPHQAEAETLAAAGLVDRVVIADARDLLGAAVPAGQPVDDDQRGEAQRHQGGDPVARGQAQRRVRPDLFDDAGEHAARAGDRVLHLAPLGDDAEHRRAQRRRQVA